MTLRLVTLELRLPPFGEWGDGFTPKVISSIVNEGALGCRLTGLPHIRQPIILDYGAADFSILNPAVFIEPPFQVSLRMFRHTPRAFINTLSGFGTVLAHMEPVGYRNQLLGAS